MAGSHRLRRDALSKAILAADEAGRLTPDFSFSTADFCGVYSERSKAQGAAYYQAIGVPHEALDDRRTASLRNLKFFDAPHVALLFMPAIGDSVRVASDIGMYAQTLVCIFVYLIATLPSLLARRHSRLRPR